MRVSGDMKRSRERGLTLVELIVAFTILSILSTMAVPLARYKVRRDKERDLADALRTMRKAIDAYKERVAGEQDSDQDGRRRVSGNAAADGGRSQAIAIGRRQGGQVSAGDSDRPHDRDSRMGHTQRAG